MREERERLVRERPERQTQDILDRLVQVRETCANFVDRLERKSIGLLLLREEDALAGITDLPMALNRVVRPLLQVAILELEILGKRPIPGARAANPEAAKATPKTPVPPPPKPESVERPAAADARPPSLADLDDLNDYRHQSSGRMVADICDAVEAIPGATLPVDRAALAAGVAAALRQTAADMANQGDGAAKPEDIRPETQRECSGLSAGQSSGSAPAQPANTRQAKNEPARRASAGPFRGQGPP